MYKILLALSCIQCTILHAQTKDTIRLLTEGSGSNIRGLSISDKNTVWTSGNKGEVDYSSDGGSSWKKQRVKGFEQKDFRDIQAFDKNTAVIMSIDTPAYILKTTDGGNTWKTVYRNNTPGMFLDAMNFNGNNGIAVGDPVNGKIFLATTDNGGDTWKELSVDVSEKVFKGEAFFASSGSNMVLRKNNQFYLVSGGTKARFFTNNTIAPLPIMQGTETTGAHAVAFIGKHIAVAGGDFNNPKRNDSCVCISDDGGKTWKLSEKQPGGFRSDIIFINEKVLICCGLNGADISRDGGNSWQPISRRAFNTCRYNKETNAVFFGGPNGSVAVLQL